MYFLTSLVAIFLLLPSCLARLPPKLVCYYAYEPFNPGHLTPEKTNSTLCTHINFSFASVRNGKIDPASSSYVEIYKRFNRLKTQNPKLKILLTLSDDGFPDGLSEMVSTRSKQVNFINYLIPYLRNYSLDGVDFDWEYPVIRTGKIYERSNFAVFLSELRTAVNQEASRSPREPLLISAAVTGVQPLMKLYYDIPLMSKSLDYINIMCYDYHAYQTYLPFTGHNSPLCPTIEEEGFWKMLNVLWSTVSWFDTNIPPEKMIIGLPTYGQTFTLMDPNKNGLFAPTIGPGRMGREVTHSFMCKFLKNATKVIDWQRGSVPYAFQKDQWISYDDVQSLTEKTKYVIENKLGNFGGIMTWSLNNDDWNNDCGQGNFPLHKAIHEILFK